MGVQASMPPKSGKYETELTSGKAFKDIDELYNLALRVSYEKLGADDPGLRKSAPHGAPAGSPYARFKDRRILIRCATWQEEGGCTVWYMRFLLLVCLI